MKKLLAILPFLLTLLLVNCKDDELPEPGTPTEPSTPVEPEIPAGASLIEASPQRTGDAAAGYEYLVTGNYVSSGIPFEIYKDVFGTNSAQDLGRSGDNQGIDFDFTVVTHANGTKVVAPNCLTCHAETFNGELIVGLGNNTTDYTINTGQAFAFLDPLVQLTYGQNSPEWEAYWPSSRSAQAIGDFIITETQGVNPADKIFAALSAHRNPVDLTWRDEPDQPIPTEVVPTDVPAWWLMKKKNALYYNALGVGDFGRLSTASDLLTMLDSAEARQIDENFPDVMAYLQSIEVPEYPFMIEQFSADQGKVLFEERCSSCHGTYGDNPTYPNLLVEVSTVGTDPALADVYQTNPQYHEWYNQSWFAQGPNAAELQPTNGYIAPPLDGIWATAPYLHNGSVPSLDDLLNSSQRPTYWRRVTFDNADFDEQKVGYVYETLDSKVDAQTYDTTLPGYGNGGHVYGDAFTDEERRAVIEYLKTL